MKKTLNPLMAAAMLATAAFAAGNVENPVYAPAQMGFFSKTGVSWMYKKSDDNDAMKAKDWVKETENPIPRITEDFGFGITDWLTFRGAFGYTYDGDIERSGMHQARLGLGLRPVNSPVDAVVWDIYADAFLGGVSKMKAEIVSSKNDFDGKHPFSFNYENYGNGRWGVWVGTQVGKTFDKLNVAVFGEVERTFGNSNNEIKIDKSAKGVMQGKVREAVPSTEGSAVYSKVYSQVHPMVLNNLPQAIGLACQQSNIPQEYCNVNTLGEATFGAIEAGATNYLEGVAKATTQRMADSVADKIAEDFVNGLPKDFNVDTKSTWEFAAGLKSLYEISNDWSIGGAFNWKHRATNSIKAVNIKNTSTNPDQQTVAAITKGIGSSFEGSMKDGVDEFALSLLASTALTDNLAITLYGEYTFDTAEEKAQLGTTMKAELGLRMNLQF